MPAHWHASRSRGRAFGRKPRAGASRFTWSGVSTLRRTSVVAWNASERKRQYRCDSVVGTSGFMRRVKRRTAASTLGGGANAVRSRRLASFDLVERAPVRSFQRRRPDRRVFLGEAPLDDHVGAGDRPAEQAAQDRSRARERQVRDDCKRLFGKAPVEDVGFDDRDVASEPSPQPGREGRVPLDRDDTCAGLEQRPGEHARAGPDVDDEVIPRHSGLADESVCQPAATKKVLAASAPGGASSDGHDKPPWSCGSF